MSASTTANDPHTSTTHVNLVRHIAICLALGSMEHIELTDRPEHPPNDGSRQVLANRAHYSRRRPRNEVVKER